MSKVLEWQSELQQRLDKAAEPLAQVAPIGASYKAPSREGKIHLGAYLPAGFKSSLRLVQAQTGEDVQSLIAKALNDLFRAHKVPVIDHD
jgi:hypothetical protein